MSTPLEDARGPLLVATNVNKRFGGLQALSNVSITIHRGEMFGLIGPNGAGKSTMFNVLTGLYHPDSGEFVFNGEPMSVTRPHVVAKRGIARTFQNIRLFANMTALENVMVGCHVRTKAGALGAIMRSRRTRDEEAQIGERARQLLQYVGIAHRATDVAKNLSYGDQRRLEIACAGHGSVVAGAG
jgi:branched-chain amino acid transport system ATP-binding protein